ncbi:MAG: N-acetylmuramoyl-L-alanine amidase [Clostridia bacterium]|nr:N-acetylmuramoyl-L-alanine amidase [Clostridia bacterium]
MAKVYLGIGHGGADSGAVSGGFKEKEIALSIGKACAEELRRHGVTVKISREKDKDMTIAAKVNECNSFGPDLAADLHINAGGGDGAEVFHSVSGGRGRTLGTDILEALEEAGQNSRGCKTKARSDGKDYFAFIRNTKAPAVIIESAFIDNKKDFAAIDTAAEQKAFGKAIAKGFLKSLGIPYKEEVRAVAYNDAKEIPKWAREAVEKVTKAGLMVGDDKGNFNPNEPVTRAQLALVLQRLEML